MIIISKINQNLYVDNVHQNVIIVQVHRIFVLLVMIRHLEFYKITVVYAKLDILKLIKIIKMFVIFVIQLVKIVLDYLQIALFVTVNN